MFPVILEAASFTYCYSIFTFCLICAKETGQKIVTLHRAKWIGCDHSLETVGDTSTMRKT